jgi:hypothetical protein
MANPLVDIDFNYLHHMMVIADLAAEKASVIKKQFRNQKPIINELEEMDGRYFILTDESNKTHILSFRGSSNIRNWLYDAAIQKAPFTVEGKEIIAHEGFLKASREAYEDVTMYLDTSYDIVLVGHSLGGAMAVLLALLLKDKGYRIHQIITFGQPKVTDLPSVQQLTELPLLRVVIEQDLVPLLPTMLDVSKNLRQRLEQLLTGETLNSSISEKIGGHIDSIADGFIDFFVKPLPEKIKLPSASDFPFLKQAEPNNDPKALSRQTKDGKSIKTTIPLLSNEFKSNFEKTIRFISGKLPRPNDTVLDGIKSQVQAIHNQIDLYTVDYVHFGDELMLLKEGDVIFVEDSELENHKSESFFKEVIEHRANFSAHFADNYIKTLRELAEKQS